MTEESKTALKAANAQATPGTVRGAGSTIGWGGVIWYFLVEQTYTSHNWHILVSDKRPANLGTFFIVGILTALLTHWFRLMEQRHPDSLWSLLMFSKGAPLYGPVSDPQPDPEPPAVVVESKPEGTTVTVNQPPPAPPAADELPPPLDPAGGTWPTFAPDPNPVAAPALVFSPEFPVSPPPYIPPTSDPAFTSLPPDVLGEVVELAYSSTPGVVFNDDPVEDEDAPHGVNTEDDKIPPTF